jgi:hypothetical protein
VEEMWDVQKEMGILKSEQARGLTLETMMAMMIIMMMIRRLFFSFW